MENRTTFQFKSKKFIDELNARKPSEKVMSADRDLESLLAMRDRRAAKHGITITETFGDINHEKLRSQPEASTYRDDRYFVTNEKIPLSHKIIFEKDHNKLYSHESEMVYASVDVIDLLDSTRLPAEAYVCPNCGDISSAEELASTGCPYCGTRFSIPQLFPKVSHFSHTAARSESKRSSFKRAIKPALITFIVAWVIWFFRSCGTLLEGASDYGVAGYLFSAVTTFIGSFFIALIPAVIAYFIATYVYTLNTAMSDTYQRVKKHSANNETAYSTRVFEKTMAEYGPIFNFNYFSSRVYNLLGAIIYAEKEEECPFYNGPEFVGGFDMIIDYIPIGMEITKFDVSDEGICTIESKVFAVTYAYENGKIRHRQTEFDVKTSKNMNYPIDINFSAHTYCCDGCSASFDATKTKSCPYCGRPHDMLDEEWYIDGKVVGRFL